MQRGAVGMFLILSFRLDIGGHGARGGHLDKDQEIWQFVVVVVVSLAPAQCLWMCWDASWFWARFQTCWWKWTFVRSVVPLSLIKTSKPATARFSFSNQTGQVYAPMLLFPEVWWLGLWNTTWKKETLSKQDVSGYSLSRHSCLSPVPLITWGLSHMLLAGANGTEMVRWLHTPSHTGMSRHTHFLSGRWWPCCSCCPEEKKTGQINSSSTCVCVLVCKYCREKFGLWMTLFLCNSLDSET